MARDIQGDGFSEAAAHEQPPPGPGHNLGPQLLLDDALFADIRLQDKAVFDRADALLDAEARMPATIDSDDGEIKATEFIRQINAADKALDAKRVDRKEPYRRGGTQVDSAYNQTRDKLVSSDRRAPGLKERVEAKLTAYKAEKLRVARAKFEAEAAAQREEEAKARAIADAARREAEITAAAAAEAAAAASRKRNAETRAAAEAAAKVAREASEKAQRESDERARAEADAADARHKAEQAASAPAAGFTRKRSASAVGSLQEFVAFRDLDRNQINLEALREHFTTDAIESALKQYIRANGDTIKSELKNNRQMLRGVAFFIDARTTVR